MMQENKKILCFGVFALILKHCRLEHVTDKQLVATIAGTVDLSNRYGQSDYQVSRLLHCETNFSNGQLKRENDTGSSNRLSNVVLRAASANVEDTSKAFQEKVVPLLDVDRTPLIVLALLGVIREDDKLDNSKKSTFMKYFGTSKNTLLEQSVFVLHEFLASAFLYTTGVDNKDGKACIDSISKEYVDSFADKIDSIRLNEPNELQTGLGTEEILDVFNRAIKKYRIIDYMNSNPSISLEASLIYYEACFCRVIQEDIIVGLIEYQKETAYQKVKEFLHSLAKYHDYLGNHLHKTADIFVQPHKEDIAYVTNFEIMVSKHKKKIDSLYGELNNGNTLFVL